MIPDNVEKIIMTKEDYDRNVEQLLVDKCKVELEVERLNNIIEELEKWLKHYIPLLEAGDIVEETTQDTLKEVLDKLNELKGDNK